MRRTQMTPADLMAANVTFAVSGTDNTNDNDASSIIIRRQPTEQLERCRNSGHRRHPRSRPLPLVGRQKTTGFLFSLFLLIIVIPLQEMNLSNNIITQVQADLSEQQQQQQTRQLPITVTNSSHIHHQHHQANASSENQTVSMATTTSASNGAALLPQAASSSTVAARAEFLLNLVKTNFQSQQHTNGNNQNATAITNRLLAPFKQRLGQQREHMHYKTTYACEGNQLDLSCEEGKLIHLVRANYGRFSLSICNELGHSNLSVQCASFRAFLLMETRCNKLGNCSVIVSKELFGDPCEGTSKYLEVQYYCDDVNNNNNNQQASSSLPAQPQLAISGSASQSQSSYRPANQAAVSSASSAVSATQQQQHSAESIIDQPSATPSQQGGHKSQVAANSNSGHHEQQQRPHSNVGGELLANSGDEQGGQAQQQQAGQLMPLQPQHATNVILQQQQQPELPLYCAPQASVRNLYWNFTRAGQVARQACPDGSIGRASWLCEPERARFVPAWSPNFSQCNSIWLQRLAHQLDQVLVDTTQQQLPAKQLFINAVNQQQQHSEQVLRLALNDLALMARTKELFSEDLRQIDIMIGKIVGQLRSQTWTNSNQWRLSQMQARRPVAAAPTLFEDLFSKLVSIVSSLFDVAQRSAWLEVQPNEERKRLEQSLLSHLKDSGALLASAYSASQLIGGALEPQPLRQANVFAAFTVISNDFDSRPNFDQQSSELILQLNQQQSNEQFFLAPEDGGQQTNAELRIHAALLRELLTNGVSRLLVLDVKKPDYALVRQQLESAYSNSAAADQLADSLSGANNNNLLLGSQQWSSRVFGVFAIGENGDILLDTTAGQYAATFSNGNSQQQQQLERRLADLLARWPISVDFKLAGHPMTASRQVPVRQCNSLTTSDSSPSNRCQTLKSNSTNHVCRCDQLGFVALVSAPNLLHLVASSNSLGASDFQWPPQLTQETSGSSDLGSSGSALDSTLGRAPTAYIGTGSSSNAASSTAGTKQGVGVWATIFIVFGLSLLVVSLAGFLVSATLRASAQSRLNKKQAGFLSAGSSILGHNHHHHHSCDQQPTTGPLAADRGLLSAPQAHEVSTTTRSSSIIGLTQAACHGGAYKSHQQLYAAQLSPLGDAAALDTNRKRNRWPRWLSSSWLVRPTRWLSFASTTDSGIGKSMSDASRMGGLQSHHRGGIMVGSSLANASSVSYKSQYQNGYTTSVHQSSQASRAPLAAPSSSTSSYVSSSAYYEEIGPGNLTKVSTNHQLAAHNSRTHTIVDPFKRQLPAPDQQQLLHHSHNQHQLHLSRQQWPPTAISSRSYSIVEPAQNLESYSATTCQQQQMQLANGLGANGKQHTDLSAHLQQVASLASQHSSANSSTGSQHSGSGSTSQTATATTPRHYLFASPSAVSAYKSSMSQHIHSQQQQQQQFRSQESTHSGRFMQN